MSSFAITFPKIKLLLLYSFAMGGLLFVVHWLEQQLVIYNTAIDLYSLSIALVFMVLGAWGSLKLRKPKIQLKVIEKEVVVEREIPIVKEIIIEKVVPIEKAVMPIPDLQQLELVGLSKRELEILQLIAGGKSNQEIATQLLVSLSTVKSHIQQLFSKLAVNRRTQAIDKARSLRLID